MSKQARHHNLDSLSQMLDNDSAALERMIAVFCESTPEIVEVLNENFREEDMEQLSRTAHKLKSSIDLFQIKELSTLVRQLEDIAHSGGTIARIEPLVTRLNQVIREVIEDLEERE